MKNSLYLPLLALLISLQFRQAYAQTLTSNQSPTTFHAGRWQLGIKEGYGQGCLLKNRNSFQLHAGYFLINKLAVGLNATWSKEWVGDFGYNDLSSGPYIRYQFTNSWISPFLEASYQVGERSSDDVPGVSYSSLSIQSTQINSGLSLGLLESLRLDLSYRLEWIYLSGRPQGFNHPQVGITYLFR